MKELEKDKIIMESQIKNFKKENGNDETTLEQIKKVFLTANTAKKTFLEYDKYKKRELLEILLWNLEIENKKIANLRFKMPYQLLANTPKNCDLATMLRAARELRTIILNGWHSYEMDAAVKMLRHEAPFDWID